MILPEIVEDEDTWPCGCSDYHYADCPSREGQGSDGMSKEDWLEYYANNPDEWDD